jgi:hypothetical protein
MKNFFRLAILSILSISLLSSCAKFKKSCSTECANSKKEEAKVEENKAPEVKKVKKAKKAKKADATAPVVAPEAVKTETKKN